jgi:hypothetical protein
VTISTWRPVERIVSAITQANPGVVTTTTAHGYLSGLYIRFFFPANFGMMQLNGNVYLITVLSPTTFSIDTDTTNFDAFTTAVTTQSPQVIPVGEVALTLANAEENTLTPVGGPSP